jgi:hypothetical protein
MFQDLFCSVCIVWAVYLLAADNYSGPLASWLIDTNQPVIRTRNAFSILRLTQLGCIRAHFSHCTPRSWVST